MKTYRFVHCTMATCSFASRRSDQMKILHNTDAHDTEEHRSTLVVAKAKSTVVAMSCFLRKNVVLNALINFSSNTRTVQFLLRRIAVKRPGTTAISRVSGRPGNWGADAAGSVISTSLVVQCRRLLDNTKVTEHILRVPRQKDVRRVAWHGDNGYKSDIEYSLLPWLQHVERRVEIVHEVVPLDLLVQAI